MRKKNATKKKISNALRQAVMSFPTSDIIGKKFDIMEIEKPLSSFGESTMHKGEYTIGVRSEKYKEHDFLGIDIPVLLKPANSATETKKCIFIIGDSPLRNDEDKKDRYNVILGIPYAIHQEENTPSQCYVYKLIFDGLLQQGYAIYLTDINKVWCNDNTLLAEKESVDVLKSEMVVIKEKYTDVFYVTWGKEASVAIEKRFKFKKKRDYLQLPHPSKNNRNNWKLHIFERAIYEKKDINYALKIYPKLECTTTETIVANESVNEILEWVKA